MEQADDASNFETGDSVYCLTRNAYAEYVVRTLFYVLTYNDEEQVCLEELRVQSNVDYSTRKSKLIRITFQLVASKNVHPLPEVNIKYMGAGVGGLTAAIGLDEV